MVAGRELNYRTSASAGEMSGVIFGDGVSVVGATYTGDDLSSAIYRSGDKVSPETTPSDQGVILSTGRVGDYTNRASSANLSAFTTTDTNGVDGDAGMDAVEGLSTFDASYLDVSFVTEAEEISIQFTFSSEEYPEYSQSIYNDIVAVWINGSFVPLAVGDGKVSVGNTNDLTTPNLYNDNTANQFNTEMDGFSVTLSLKIPVTPTVDPTLPNVNTIRIGIADVADFVFDSNLLIASDSVQSVLIADEDDISIGAGQTGTFDVLSHDMNTSPDPFGTVEVTHINGVAVEPGDSVTLKTGQTVTLNSDFTFEVMAIANAVENSDGVMDTAFVNLETVPRFVAGTMILTPRGERRIEDLRPGDLVATRDGPGAAHPLVRAEDDPRASQPRAEPHRDRRSWRSPHAPRLAAAPDPHRRHARRAALR